MYLKNDGIRCVVGFDPISRLILSIATSSFFFFHSIYYEKKVYLNIQPISTEQITSSQLKSLNTNIPWHLSLRVNRHVHVCVRGI